MIGGMDLGARAHPVPPGSHSKLPSTAVLAQRRDRYASVQLEVARITDGVGMPIDLGIRSAVVGLRVHGLPTVMSCEGHLDRGVGYPWIALSSPEAEDLANRLQNTWVETLAGRLPVARRVYDSALRAGRRYRWAASVVGTVNRPTSVKTSLRRTLRLGSNRDRAGDIHESDKAMKARMTALNQPTVLASKQLLDEFYSAHRAPSPAPRLVVWDTGGWAVAVLPAEVRETYLREGWTPGLANSLDVNRKEFVAFADFMRDRFLREGPVTQE